jgi:hypothetical protein
MKAKVSVFVVVSVIIFAIGTARVYLRSKEQIAEQVAKLEKAEDRGTLKWYARMAKAKGQNKISIVAQQATYGDEVKDLDDALRYNQMVLAVPIEKRSFPFEDAGIRTWYKFKIVEKLSHRKLRSCQCVPPDLVAPQEMLPLSADEILIPRAGGSTTVDGVEVLEDDPQFAQFAISRRYLLFLQTDDSGQIGLLQMGPIGVYVEEAVDRLEPLSRRPNALASDITTRFGSSIQSLRDHTRKE